LQTLANPYIRELRGFFGRELVEDVQGRTEDIADGADSTQQLVTGGGGLEILSSDHPSPRARSA
jgi:hypothetical protein